ncbi:MAG: hypothetical protein GY904_19295, partial [Planctomycetaceae bacterium]|nr:hypothetical protein [Planctomycetaceae bacterium]
MPSVFVVVRSAAYCPDCLENPTTAEPSTAKSATAESATAETATAETATAETVVSASTTVATADALELAIEDLRSFDTTHTHTAIFRKNHPTVGFDNTSLNERVDDD